MAKKKYMVKGANLWIGDEKCFPGHVPKSGTRMDKILIYRNVLAYQKKSVCDRKKVLTDIT